MTATQPSTRAAAPAGCGAATELTFLRLVPGDSFVHRLWAGTKLLVAAGLAIVLTISPTWQMLGVATGVVLIGCSRRASRSARSRVCRSWFFAALAIGAGLNLRSGVKPVRVRRPVELSIGGLGEWARFTALDDHPRRVGRAHRLDHAARRRRARAAAPLPAAALGAPARRRVGGRDRARDPLPAAAHRRDPRARARPAGCARTARTGMKEQSAETRSRAARGDPRSPRDRDRHVDTAGARPRRRDRSRAAASAARVSADPHRTRSSPTGSCSSAPPRCTSCASRCYISDMQHVRARSYRPSSFPHLPRHDDVRPPGRRGRRRARSSTTRPSSGVTFLDTADVYPLGGDLTTVGRTEEIVGRWLAGQARRVRRRDEVLRADGPQPLEHGQQPPSHHGRDRRVAAAAADRLRRPVPTALRRPAACRSTRRSRRSTTSCASGKVRYVGCSNFLAYRLARALGRSEVRSIARFESVQPRYNLLFREFERELFPLCLDERHRRHPVQPDRGRDAVGEARPHEGARRRHAVHARATRRGRIQTATGTTTCSTPSTSS